ncbi:cyclic nucleotide-binding protein [Candidatus Vecturithrix granuli]|uniref:Cyclic nucleotide-binding protein n=1 Tax=Vecturithrix granuli TaxID=1499967 RepID=A0A081BZR9_VECG1|nr:cyclic nucleotide-binding protein [Candidatus Vecturithrix granuli]
MATYRNQTICSEKRAVKEQEIEYYQRIIQKFPPTTPFSINAHIKLGKLYAALGNTESAIQEYSLAATQYVQNGTVIKAMAVNKMIAMLDPQQQDILSQSSHLYFHQGQAVKTVVPENIEYSLDDQEETTFPEYEHDHHDEIFFFSEEHPPKTELAKKLALIPLFSHLTEIERQKIAEFLSPVHIKAGEAIITEGESGDCMYLIQAGEVAIYTSLMIPENQHTGVDLEEKVQLALLKEGDFFGEQALITNEPRNATVIALTDIQLWRFSKPDLNVILKQYPRIGSVLLHHHQQRIANALECLHAAFQRIRNP